MGKSSILVTPLGKSQVQVDVDVSGFSEGLYIASLILADNSSYSVKFIIR
jgi:hypothetical protein